MKKRNYIYLFRHGQTTYNRDKIFTGHKDAKLTTKGKQQAKKITQLLKNKHINVAIHSHLSRSIDTLKPILKTHPECTLIIQDDRIIERNYGTLEGIKHQTFINRIGKQEYSLITHGDAMENLEPEQRKEIEQFLGTKEYKTIHRGYNIAAENGESFADVEKRIKPFIKDLKKFIKKNNVNVAISAHGNSIRLFRKIIERASKQETISWTIPYDTYYEYTISNTQ